MKRGFIIAGEASAELYASKLIKELKNCLNPLEMAGIGGDRLAAEDVTLVEHYSHISVVGVSEVLGHLKKIRAAIKKVVQWIKTNNPDFVIFIDLPDFNFKVIKKIKKFYKGKIIYFISPQIWAWREKRKFFLKENVDKMLVILPFEKRIYEDIGFNVEYLGHPLVDIIEPTMDSQRFRDKYGIKEKSRIITVFPGSRVREVQNHRNVLKLAIEKLKLNYSDIEFCVVPANDIIYPLIKESFDGSRIKIVDKEDNYNAIFASNVVIAKSGTTTLETALAKKPAVVVYRVGKISYLIAKLVVKVPFVSLPNVILDDMVYPEFIQEQFTADNIHSAVKRFLDDTELYIYTIERLSELEKMLGEKGFFGREENKIKDWGNR